MDSRRFKVKLKNFGSGIYEEFVESEDVVVTEGFVIFINSDEENTVTVAMFNVNDVISVMEVSE